ncbi:patatin-like phospholipase family protein [Hydrogenophaga soli]
MLQNLRFAARRLLIGPILLAAATGCTALWAADAAPAVAAMLKPTPSPSSAKPRRPVVGLVLSGGGARGFAHVGVLRALEEAHVPVDLVVGTSMGAIVGGLYASGMSPQALQAELLSIPWNTLFERRAPRPTLPQHRKEDDFNLLPIVELGFRDGEFRVPTGAVSTRSLEWLLRHFTLHTRKLTHFDALSIPFRAVATDMETGEPVVLDRGDLAAALRASMSVPGVFSPLEMDGRILGDGGLVNNLPVDVARAMGADVVIAVNIGTPLAGRETLNDVLGVSQQMINILTEQNVQRSIALLTVNDLLLSPSLGKHSSADFDRAEDISRIGLDYGQSVGEALARFAVSPDDYAQWQLGRQAHTEPLPGALAYVRFEGVTPQQAAQLNKLVDTQAGQPLDPAKLNGDLEQLSASGDYDQVDYRLVPDPHTLQDGLVFELKENDWGPNYLRAGLDLHTNFRGDSAFNLRLAHSRHWLTESGTEWRNQLGIGANTEARTELYHPWGGDHDRYLSVHATARSQRVELFALDGTQLALYNRNTHALGIDHGWSLGRGGRLGSALIGLFANRRTIDSVLISTHAASQVTAPETNAADRWTESGLRFRLVTDQLDQTSFPREGHRMVADAELGHRRSDGTRKGFHRLEWTGNWVHSWRHHTLNSHARVARASDIPAGAMDEYSLGGFQQLSGFKPGQVAGNYLGLVRLGYYQRLDIDPGIARGFYAGGSMEWGNAWRDTSEIRWGGLKKAYSLYVAADTGLGPVYLALVKGQGQSPGVYLFLGRP